MLTDSAVLRRNDAMFLLRSLEDGSSRFKHTCNQKNNSDGRSAIRKRKNWVENLREFGCFLGGTHNQAEPANDDMTKSGPRTDVVQDSRELAITALSLGAP